MDQDEVIGRLAAGEAVAGDGSAPERIDTHISVVFLTADRAYKLKRAATTSYLDYGTLADRRRYCEAEIEINRRTAPAIYLRAVPVTLETDRSLALGGDGEPVEWLVEMARFDTAKTFDRLAQSGALDETLIRDLADEIADFHGRAASVDGGDGRGIVLGTVEENDAELRHWTDAPFAARDIDTLTEAHRALLDRHGGLLDARAETGRIRHCHGDLHLRNICLIDGRPTLFDAIEFNEAFSNIDVMYDLAFLLMDFAHTGHAEYGNLAFNRYLLRTGDLESLPLVPLFQSLRAAIRAHVTAKAAGEQPSHDAADRMRDEAAAYLALAHDMLTAPPPQAIALGGFSGTGKSTLARRIAPMFAPAPGAVIVSSDPARKKLLGVSPEDRLPETAYAPDVDEKVFAAMFTAMYEAVAGGFSVVLDMTFRDSDLRARAERRAADAGAPFTGFWLEASQDVLEKRVAGRENDASDATTDVLARQIASGTGEITWRRIDTAASLRESHDRVSKEIAGLVAA